MSLIQARNVHKRYGRHKALDGATCSIERGRIVGLIGPNGAGKTTLIKALLGLTRVDGELSVLGLNPYTQRDALMQRVCFIADVAILPRWLRAADAVSYLADMHPRFDRARCNDFLARTKLTPRMRVREMSKGMVAQLHLALVMAIDVELLVLDEPTLGLDILFRRNFYDTLLNDYFDHQRTILITTHQVEEIQHLLTDLLFIRDGRIVLDATMDQVGEAYVEVLVRADQAAAARELQPLTERRVFGRHLFLFKTADRKQLEALGELNTPGVAELFVAVMQEPMQ